MWKLNSVIDLTGPAPCLVFVNEEGSVRVVPCQGLVAVLRSRTPAGTEALPVTGPPGSVEIPGEPEPA